MCGCDGGAITKLRDMAQRPAWIDLRAGPVRGGVLLTDLEARAKSLPSGNSAGALIELPKETATE
jgi:hypothetical protein